MTPLSTATCGELATLYPQVALPWLRRPCIAQLALFVPVDLTCAACWDVAHKPVLTCTCSGREFCIVASRQAQGKPANAGTQKWSLLMRNAAMQAPQHTGWDGTVGGTAVRPRRWRSPGKGPPCTGASCAGADADAIACPPRQWQDSGLLGIASACSVSRKQLQQCEQAACCTWRECGRCASWQRSVGDQWRRRAGRCTQPSQQRLPSLRQHCKAARKYPCAPIRSTCW